MSKYMLEPRNELGRLLRCRRLALGLTQHTVAEAIGTSIVYVSDVEVGRKLPALPSEPLRQMALVLELDPDHVERVALRDRLMRIEAGRRLLAEFDAMRAEVARLAGERGVGV